MNELQHETKVNYLKSLLGVFSKAFEEMAKNYIKLIQELQKNSDILIDDCSSHDINLFLRTYTPHIETFEISTPIYVRLKIEAEFDNEYLYYKIEDLLNLIGKEGKITIENISQIPQYKDLINV